jgi:hypothetical protein
MSSWYITGGVGMGGARTPPIDGAGSDTLETSLGALYWRGRSRDRRRSTSDGRGAVRLTRRT